MVGTWAQLFNVICCQVDIVRRSVRGHSSRACGSVPRYVCGSTRPCRHTYASTPVQEKIKAPMRRHTLSHAVSTGIYACPFHAAAMHVGRTSFHAPYRSSRPMSFRILAALQSSCLSRPSSSIQECVS